jgi:hypothetical protein
MVRGMRPPNVRELADSEKALLRPVFGLTLFYDDLWIGRNDMLWGGPYNS